MSELIIAPWGNPENWKKVSYLYDGKKCVTPACTLALSDMLSIKNIVVILSSTLMDKPANNYRELEDKVKEKIKSTNILTSNEIKLWVAPGIGRFGKDKVYIHKGSIDLYYNYVYYNTLTLFNEINDEIKLHLDLTHGINYMPIMVREAIELAAATYAAANGKRIEIIIYNSDPLSPIPKQDDPSIELNINQVANVKFKPYESLNELLTRLTLNYDFNIFRWSRISNQNSVSKDDIESIYKASKAGEMGLLLVIGSIMGKLKDIKGRVDDTLKKLLEPMIECKIDDPLIFDYTLKLKKEVSLLHAILHALTSINIEAEVKLSTLKELNEKFYKNTAVYSILSNELHCICNLDINNQYTLYAELKYGEEFDKTKEGRTDQRTLYAHAGLEENVTLLRRDDGDIYLKYKYIDNILEQI
ncbi:MAG: CRISPR-associated CARF protein Csx1 [Candidatus Nitrosocaldaceae archaeon]